MVSSRKVELKIVAGEYKYPIGTYGSELSPTIIIKTKSIRMFFKRKKPEGILLASCINKISMCGH
jgi:hypothetical protein